MVFACMNLIASLVAAYAVTQHRKHYLWPWLAIFGLTTLFALCYGIVWLAGVNTVRLSEEKAVFLAGLLSMVSSDRNLGMLLVHSAQCECFIALSMQKAL